MESGFGSNEKNGLPTTDRMISATGTSACSLIGLFEKLATRAIVSPSLGITKVRSDVVKILGTLEFPPYPFKH